MQKSKKEGGWTYVIIRRVSSSIPNQPYQKIKKKNKNKKIQQKAKTNLRTATYHTPSPSTSHLLPFSM
jgi:hypothetical protein